LLFSFLAVGLLSSLLFAQAGKAPEKRLAARKSPVQKKRRVRHPAAATPVPIDQTALSETPLPTTGSAKDKSASANSASRLAQVRPFQLNGPRRYDQPGEALRLHLRKRLPEGATALPIERYLEADTQMKRMPQYSTARGIALPARAEMAASEVLPGQWTPLGPGNIGGRTRALLVHPTTPNVMYAAGVSGGIWKTTNGGQSWTPLADLMANIAVNSLALDPKNPDVIYAGTGEGFIVGEQDTLGDFRGAGIFKTMDGGATWTRLASTTTADFHFVNDLVVSPVNSQRIYAATRTGVWRSMDGGATWTQALNPVNASGSPLQGGCLDLAIRTDQMTDYLFASCGTFVQASIYRNTDAAGSGEWTVVHTESGMGRTSLAIAPSDQNVIYALSASVASGSFRNGLHAVFRSMTGGASGSWTAQVRNTNPTKLNTTLLSNPWLLFRTDCGLGTSNGFSSQGWYDNVIAVDPLDANRVWAGGIDLFRSDDGGSNWGQASHWWANGGIAPLAPQYAHADQHVIVFHPSYNGTTNKTMFVGGDGGLFRTDDARAPVAIGNKAPCDPVNTAVRWVSLNNNYGVTQFYHGLPLPDGKGYFGGTQDNGTLLGTDNGGVNGWREINGGDGGYVAVEPDGTTLYANFPGLNIQKSTDGGATFSSAIFGITDSGTFVNPYVMDPSDAQRLWAGDFYLWRTTSGAALWSRASALTAGSGSVSALAIAPTDANYALAGMEDGYILRTEVALTSGATTIWADTRPRSGWVSSVAFDPANRNIAYATYSTFGGTHVWRTVNAGTSWTGLDGSGAGALPDVPVHSLVVDSSNTARLFIGTDLGVFVTTDGGANWAVENTGFANVITESLSLNVVGGVTTLYAFTHGRGAWKVTANLSGCNYSISPATREVAAAGGDLTVNVSAAPGGCDWRAESNATWLTTSSSGTVVTVKVAENKTFARRSGTVTVAGRSFAVVQEGQPDFTAPTITITNPAPPGPVTNTSGSLSLSGAASDDQAVQAVSWTTDRGSSGSASGTSSWLISGLPLMLGRNVITVTAQDVAGNLSRASLTVNATLSSFLVTVAGTGLSGFSGDNGQAQAARITRAIRLDIDNAGNLYFTDSDNHRIRKIAPNGVITTVAGTGTRGFSGDNGPATAAQLNFPIGIAVDGSGNLYIADNGNHAVRKVTVSTGIISTIVGVEGSSGFAGDGGPSPAARLNSPQNVAVDKDGNLYISDFSNHRIRKVTASTGLITTIAGTGTAGFSGDDGTATAAQLNGPNNVSVDSNGNLYICDATNARIRKITAATGVISTIVGTGGFGFGGDGGLATAAQINGPVGAIVDSAGNLYFSDRANHRVRRVAASSGIITTIAGSGVAGFNGDGIAALAARLSSPSGLALDPAGNLYIGDRDNSRLRRLVVAPALDAVAPTIAITAPTTGATHLATTASLDLSGTAGDNTVVFQVRWSNDRGGSGVASGTTAWTIAEIALQSGLNNLTVTAWDANGNTSSAQLAVTFNPAQLIFTLAGTNVFGSSGDGGAATAARLWFPSAVALDRQGNVYICDTQNHRVRRIAPNGTITAFAGSGALGSSGDGGPAAAAAMNEPLGIAVDAAGNVYIADSRNNRVRIVTPDGKINTFAGTGRDGFGGDNGAAQQASLSSPIGLAVDAAGNLYIADAGNARVRRVTASDGKINTIAGNGFVGFAGDGGAAKDAMLNAPVGVAVDGAGNVYFTDYGNSRVRRVAVSNNTISTIAGTGTNGYNGDNVNALTAQVNFPFHLAVDAAGDLYVADQANHRIRKITISSNTITTVAGNGIRGFSGDGGSPTAAQLNFPVGVAVDTAGNLFIAEDRIRRTRPASEIGTAASVSGASYFRAGDLAADSIVSAFGTNLATTTQVAPTIPLPTALAGTTVTVRDNLGVTRLAPLFYVSPDQVNYQIPNGTANGVATVLINSPSGTTLTGTVNITAVAPGLFAANANGQGLAAAVVQRNRANGTVSYEPAARLDTTLNRYVPVPLELGAESDQVFLLLYGTGFRFRSALSNVSATVGGEAAQVLYAGIAPGFIGLDQANVRLNRSLIGRGDVEVTFIVDGKAANPVRVTIR
jgi:uncharacterized protein (TIGR03437 family)